MTWKQLLSLLVSAIMTLTSFFQSGIGTPEEPFDPGTDPGTSVTEPAPIVEPEFPDNPDQTEAAFTPCIFHIAPEEVWLLPGDRAELIVEAEPVLPNDGQTDAPDPAEEPTAETVPESPEAASDPEAGMPIAEEATGEKKPGTETTPETGLTAEERFEETPAEEKHVSSTSESAAEEPTQTVLSVECDDEPTILPASTGSQEDAADIHEAVNEEDEIPTEEGILNCSFDPDLLEWRSENEAIAVVDQNGLVTAVSLGETVVSVYLPDRDATATCAVYVVEELPSPAAQKASALLFGRVAISQKNNWNYRPEHETAQISGGYAYYFDVYRCDKNGRYTGRDGDLNGRVTWFSDNTKVATVDQYGRVTAVGEGTAIISVKSQYFWGYISVFNPVHVAVYKSESGKAIVKSWVSQYQCTDKRSGHKCEVRTVSPGTELQIHGKSGGYYYANIAGQGARFFMWAAYINKQSDTSSVKICNSDNKNDTRRHWILMKGDTLSLSLKNDGKCNWKTFLGTANIVSFNGQSTAQDKRSVTIRAENQGGEFIIASQGSKIDVIHVSVVAQYPTPKAATTVSICGQYRCSHAKCTISDHAVKNVQPNRSLVVYGESGGFYYAKVAGESDRWFMWKSNVSVNWGSWEKKCTLQNTLLNTEEKTRNDSPFLPQGFAVDDQYAYSFEVRRYGDPGAETDEHRLFRYNLDTGALTKMNAIGSDPIELLHANDAAVVTFRENGRDQKYLFVTKFFSGEKCSIVKLSVNDDAGTYQKIAEYPVDKEVSGITLFSGGGIQPAVFLLKAQNMVYRATIANDLVLNSDQNLSMSLKFSVSTTYPQIYSSINTPQGIHYEPTNDRLYLPFSANAKHRDYQGSFTSVIRCYNSISTATGTRSENSAYEFTHSPSFEIEGVGFRLGSTDRSLWFSASGNGNSGGIYKDSSIMR